jgi:hypothetical protein
MQAREKQPRRLHEAEATQQSGRDVRRQQREPVAERAPRNQVAAISQGSDSFIFLLFFFFLLGFSIFPKLQTLESLAPSQLSLFNLSCLVVGPVPLSYSRIRADDGKLIWRVVS